MFSKRSKLTVMVTGGSGFIGSALTSYLFEQGFDLIVPRRLESKRKSLPNLGWAQPVIANIDAFTNWTKCLQRVDVVIHCAAISNLPSRPNNTVFENCNSVNVRGTLNLAYQAAKAGVRRFIFLSSIKVNGENTDIGQLFRPTDEVCPKDLYGLSKRDAEKGLRKISSDTGMEVVIIRPPLVYGPNVEGNFAKLSALVAKGVPLPLAMVKNQRSFIAIDNLVDLIITCINHPKAANQTFLASDGQDLSMPELLNGMATAMGRDIKLFPFPSLLLRLGAEMIGKKVEANRLLGSLQLDISMTRDVLGWSPVINVEEGLRRCFDTNRQN